ncbi:hypothetical protein WJ69_12405 [Burkholderia ubonensis]|nr:hypothetical protein WJ69_12405 [Burkholderia ubonensis]KVO13522.1 hypothetical protein WJ73_15565 [Burkholderia ubonensis]
MRSMPRGSARGTSQPNPISAAHMNASAATITVLKCRSMASPVSTLPSRPAAPDPNSSSAMAAGATPGICRRTRFTNTNLNPLFQRKLASLGGLFGAGADIGSLQGLLLDPAWFQRVRNAGSDSDLLLSGRTNVSAKVKRVWEPVFMLGASYQVTRRF